jgi:hypothetical protein
MRALPLLLFSSLIRSQSHHVGMISENGEGKWTVAIALSVTPDRCLLISRIFRIQDPFSALRNK